MQIDTPETEDWIKGDRAYINRRRPVTPDDITKALSSKFGKPDKRRAQLVARLKRRQKYGDPVKGGTGRHKKKGKRRRFK